MGWKRIPVDDAPGGRRQIDLGRLRVGATRDREQNQRKGERTTGAISSGKADHAVLPLPRHGQAGPSWTGLSGRGGIGGIGARSTGFLAVRSRRTLIA